MTSNLGSLDLVGRASTPAPDSTPVVADISELEPDEVTEVFNNAVRDYFTSIGRLEILGRLEQSTVAFQPLRPPVIEQIVTKVLANASFVHGPDLKLDAPSAVAYAQTVMADPRNRNLGGRQIRNIFRTAFLRLAGATILGGYVEARELAVRFEIDGAMHVVVDDDARLAIPPAGGPIPVRQLTLEKN